VDRSSLLTQCLRMHFGSIVGNRPGELIEWHCEAGLSPLIGCSSLLTLYACYRHVVPVGAQGAFKSAYQIVCLRAVWQST
jgi:hypothetical protein